MKDSIQNRLMQIEARHEEIALLLSTPEVMAEQNKFRDLSCEYAQLGPVVNNWRKWKDNQVSMDEARQMLADFQTGRARGNWIKLAAHGCRRIGLHVEAILMRHAAGEKDKDDRLRRWSATGSRHRPHRRLDARGLENRPGTRVSLL